MTGSALTYDQLRVLDLVLDEIIPPSEDGRLPGAGALGLASHVEAALLDMPELRKMIADGLTALNNLARRYHGHGFAKVPRHHRLQLLSDHATSEHAFPPILVLHTYAAYYQDARVLAALGLPPRPPHPEGYAMEPDDLTLLDPVRRRRPMYRSP